MKRSIIFDDEERWYTLTKDAEDQLFLEVTCGSLAMQDFVIKLTDEEVEAYRTRGKATLDLLAVQVCKERQRFVGRFVTV